MGLGWTGNKKIRKRKIIINEKYPITNTIGITIVTLK